MKFKVDNKQKELGHYASSLKNEEIFIQIIFIDYALTWSDFWF